jgi:ubiquitin-conjugating enzyme E2 variant
VKGAKELGRTSQAAASRGAFLVDALVVGAAAALASSMVARVAGCAPGAHVGTFVAGIPLGLFAADAATAVIHWFFDTYLAPDTPILGRRVVAPFREHHVAPEAMAGHGLLERNANSCLAAMPVLVAARAALDLGGPWKALASGCLVTASVALCLSNQIHAWAHTARPPALVRWLQVGGVLLRPDRHATHHRGAHACAYGVVSGWSNVWLDRARMFARLEAVLAARFPRRSRLEPR